MIVGYDLFHWHLNKLIIKSEDFLYFLYFFKDYYIFLTNKSKIKVLFFSINLYLTQRCTVGIITQPIAIFHVLLMNQYAEDQKLQLIGITINVALRPNLIFRISMYFVRTVNNII